LKEEVNDLVNIISPQKYSAIEPEKVIVVSSRDGCAGFKPRMQKAGRNEEYSSGCAASSACQKKAGRNEEYSFGCTASSACQKKAGRNDIAEKGMSYRPSPSSTRPTSLPTQEQKDKLKELIEERRISNNWLLDFFDWIWPPTPAHAATIKKGSKGGKGHSYENGWFEDFLDWLPSKNSEENGESFKDLFHAPTEKELEALKDFILRRSKKNGWFGDFVDWLKQNSETNGQPSEEEIQILIKDFISNKGKSDYWFSQMMYDVIDYLSGKDPSFSGVPPPQSGGSSGSPGGPYFENKERPYILDDDSIELI